MWLFWAIKEWDELARITIIWWSIEPTLREGVCSHMVTRSYTSYILSLGLVQIYIGLQVRKGNVSDRLMFVGRGHAFTQLWARSWTPPNYSLLTTHSPRPTGDGGSHPPRRKITPAFPWFSSIARGINEKEKKWTQKSPRRTKLPFVQRSGPLPVFQS